MFGHDEKTKLIALILCSSAAALTACGGAGTESPDDADEFADAIPSAAMVDLSDEGDATASAALTSRQGLGGPESAFRDHIDEVRSGVNDLVARTHDVIDTIRAEGTVVVAEVDGKDCRVWDWDGPRAAYRMLVCRENGQVEGVRGDAYGFLIAGRPLGSTDDDDFKAITAGVGAKLEGPNGGRGGMGRIAYDFDNLSSLNGEEYRGKIGIGYYAGRRLRSAVLGLKDAKGKTSEDAVTALYRFDRIVGKGGRFVFLTEADFMTREGEDQSLELGEDGVAEFGRAALAWNAEGKARTAFAACGGTVGDGACVQVHQCWDRNGDVTFGDISETGTPSWEPTSCGAVELSPEIPAEGDVAFGGDTDGLAIPDGDE